MFIAQPVLPGRGRRANSSIRRTGPYSRSGRIIASTGLVLCLSRRHAVSVTSGLMSSSVSMTSGTPLSSRGYRV